MLFHPLRHRVLRQRFRSLARVHLSAEGGRDRLPLPTRRLLETSHAANLRDADLRARALFGAQLQVRDQALEPVLLQFHPLLEPRQVFPRLPNQQGRAHQEVLLEAVCRGLDQGAPRGHSLHFRREVGAAEARMAQMHLQGPMR